MSGEEYSYDDFLKVHSYQLTNSNVPAIYWEHLFVKLKNEVFDAGLSFQILCEEEVQEEEEEEEEEEEGEEDTDGGKSEAEAREEQGTDVQYRVVVTAEDGIKCDDPKHIYLIDHAWTYGLHEARPHLTQIPGLAERMANIVGVKVEGRSKEEVIEDILRQMWRFNQTYFFRESVQGYDMSIPKWYIMDEFGSAIQHCKTPSVKTAPFHYGPAQTTFTIMWPLHNLETGDEVTRDLLYDIKDPLKRAAKLNAWQFQDLTDVPYQQTEPVPQYFKEHSIAILEALPIPGNMKLPTDRRVKVFLDYAGLPELTDPRFEVITEKEAEEGCWFDIHYSMSEFKDFRSLSTEKLGRFINQFPYEKAVTFKDLLYINCGRSGFGKIDPETLKNQPKWLPLSYNLQTEMPQFVSYFQHRQQKGLGNVWIVKPWNNIRGMDMYVTDNLSQILRLAETAPKVASDYVTDVVTFYRDDISGNVKFDIRYEVLLRSVRPLKLYVHRVFVVRCANKPYDLEHLDDVEKHFTMLKTHVEMEEVYEIPKDVFVPKFESQYPEHNWEDVENSIFSMFVEAFEACTEKDPPAGIGYFPNSRAVFGADVLLQWQTNDRGERTMQPIICEFNFSPNLEMFKQFHPDLMNDIFSVLYLDDLEGRPVTVLKS